MSKDLLRDFDKEFSLFILGWLEERGRDSGGLRVPGELLGRSPIGAPGVERVQDDITAAEVQKAPREFKGRIIDDCGLASRLDLAKQLQDDGAFTRRPYPR